MYSTYSSPTPINMHANWAIVGICRTLLKRRMSQFMLFESTFCPRYDSIKPTYLFNFCNQSKNGRFFDRVVTRCKTLFFLTHQKQIILMALAPCIRPTVVTVPIR